MLMYDKTLDTYYEVIPVSKIEEKIQELEKECESCKDECYYAEFERPYDYFKSNIKVLQQLIDENKEEEQWIKN